MARCRELGIDALEMAWVHSVALKEEGGARVRAAAEQHGLRLSVHAPYYINLNSHDPVKLAGSKERIVAAGRAASWAGARDVVLHLAYYHDDPPRDVHDRVTAELVEARERLVEDLADPDASGVILRPEVMGRSSQYGDLDEILDLCRRVPGTAPCLDIAHLHARTQRYNTSAEFDDMWDSYADALGESALRDVHVHISGIAYGELGEKKHLPFEEADLDYEAFLGVMRDRGVEGLVVVESPAREDDVLLLAGVWRRLALEATAG
ncbi:MAG: TIM barrel protein [Anaerolineae bacterium]